jgi:hypothetical protein
MQSSLQRFSSGSFPPELVLYIVDFLSKNERNIVFQLSKKWLDLLLCYSRKIDHRKAILQCLISIPTLSSLNYLYGEACLAATTLSCHWGALNDIGIKNPHSRDFIRDSENYAKALVRFFRQPKEKRQGIEACDHLRTLSTELLPSLDRYPSGQAYKLSLGILQKHAPHYLHPEDHKKCIIS